MRKIKSTNIYIIGADFYLCLKKKKKKNKKTHTHTHTTKNTRQDTFMRKIF
jgi:hypothetical protein